MTTSARSWRSLAAVMASAAGAGLTVGLTVPLISLVLERDGVSATLIGLNTAMSALAVVVIDVERPCAIIAGKGEGLSATCRF